MRTVAKGLCIAVIAAVLAGCTEERAIALKTAADAFSDKAVVAIDAVVDLHLRALIGKQVAEETLIKKTQQDLLLTQKTQPSSLDSVIGNSFQWLDEREKLRQTAFADYDRVKTAYVEFASAYQRLPEGSLLAAKDVSCSAALGARLVKTMVDAAKQLGAHPVPLTYEIASSKVALVTGAATAVKVGNDQELSDAVRGHVALLKDQQKANTEAVSKVLDAVTAGEQVLEMIDKYADVSASDLIRGLRHVLMVRESSFGLSSKSQMARFDDVMNRINSKPALAKALQEPVSQSPSVCK